MPGPIYEDALTRFIPIGNNKKISIIDWIKFKIDTSKNGIIRLEASDIRNALGAHFKYKKDSTIFEALRHVMREKHNINVRSNKVDGGLILTFVYKNPSNIKSQYIVKEDVIWRQEKRL